MSRTHGRSSDVKSEEIRYGQLKRSRSQSSIESGTTGSDESSNNSSGNQQKRRHAHTLAEQKRRDAIKRGYSDLKEAIPACRHMEERGLRVTNQVVAEKSIQYLQSLLEEKNRGETNQTGLQREMVGLQIMRDKYQQIIRSQTIISHDIGEVLNTVPEETKFHVFRNLMDSLYHSFSQQVSMQNFPEMSSCVINWLEDFCQPAQLEKTVVEYIRDMEMKVSSED